MVDDENEEDDRLSSSYERCLRFHIELNSFICARTEEWDLNQYEIIGILLTELMEQTQWFIDDDEEASDDEEDENDEDDEDDGEDGEEWKRGKRKK